MPASELISFRLQEAELSGRVDRLVEALAKAPEYRGIKVTRAMVLNLIFAAGVEALEERHGVAHKPATKKRRK